MKQKDWKYKAGKYKYDFQQYELIRSFGESICSGKISIYELAMDQTNLLENMVKYSKKFRPKTKKLRTKSKILLIV